MKNVFLEGSIISGFKRQKTLGEIIAPSKPVREARVVVQGECYPCDPLWACTSAPCTNLVLYNKLGLLFLDMMGSNTLLEKN